MAKIYTKQPEDFVVQARVVAIYVEVEGKLLFLQLSKEKQEVGCYGVPAGKIEEGEDIVEAARRELFEETAIRCSLDTLYSLGVLYVRKKDIEYEYHLFRARLPSYPEVILSKEHSQYVWAEYKEGLIFPLMEAAHEALEYYSKACSAE